MPSAREPSRGWLLSVGLVLLGVGALGVFSVPGSVLGQAFGAAVLLTCLACAGAALSRAPAWQRLGLGPAFIGPLTLLLLVAGAVVLSHTIDSALRGLELRDVGTLAEIDAALGAPDRAPIWLLLVGLALAPGVAEELLFRGLLQGGLTARLGPVLGVLISSLLFAVAHGDLIHSSGTFFLGLYLGTVTVRAGSLRPAILCHVVNNALVVLSAGVVPFPPPIPPLAIPLGVALSLLPLVALRGKPIQAGPGCAEE